MKKTTECLDLYRPALRHETTGGVALRSTGAVKEKLLQELVALEKQMDLLEDRAATIDFSMLQTYKEMIHSRRVFFNQLHR